MRYYISLFSPETFQKFLESSKDISGFRKKQENAAKHIKKGDILVCYMTRISRFFALFEVIENYFIDDKPIFVDSDDPYVVRFKIKPIVLLDINHSVPIFDEKLWDKLSFTKKRSWTAMVRSSLREIDEEDGKIIESVLKEQEKIKRIYKLDEKEEKKLKQKQHRVKSNESIINVSVPEDDEESYKEAHTPFTTEIRESIKIQAEIARIGTMMNFKIWVPKSDIQKIRGYLKNFDLNIIDELPLNYDDTTLKTIENIDVLWLKGRSIVRAFEVEHTTSIYSGILRMADLMALQPNLDIKAHIVAPEERKEKVFQEITRPVFSLLDGKPLSERCSFISYDSVLELSKERQLQYMNDMVLEQYEEYGVED
ncbi:EVE domain-containing protein [Aminiphilus circumscriptus]|jgi:predicted RNA-binding protein|uniref:EVE domain-containing protein n=1 Tax=Aminiphilus circumscriptus TaxID=290732 RepID=UPI00047854B7|nr:EVE domain-containing protein [Aminiphilus circumscriptus]